MHAVANQEVGKGDVAANIFGELLKNSKNDDILRSSTYLLSQIHSKNRELSKAKNLLNEFSKRWGATPLVVYGMLELEMFDNQKVFLDLYRRFVEGQNDERYNLLLAKYLVERQDYGSAISIYIDYVRENPSPEILFVVADLYQHINEYDLSKYYYTRAESGAPAREQKSKIAINKALLLLKQGDFSNAKSILENIENFSDFQVASWYNQSLIAKIENDQKKYKSLLQKAYLYADEVDDNKLKAKIYLQYALENARIYNFVQANRLVKAASAFDPENEKIAFFSKNGFRN